MPGVSGFNFEVSMTDCWHNPAVSRPVHPGPMSGFTIDPSPPIVHPLPPTCCRNALRPMPRPSAGGGALRDRQFEPGQGRRHLSPLRGERCLPSVGAGFRSDLSGAGLRRRAHVLGAANRGLGDAHRRFGLATHQLGRCHGGRRRTAGDDSPARPDLARPTKLKAAAGRQNGRPW
jgi:hypothetical protein